MLIAQSFEKSRIQEDALNQIGIGNMIEGIFLVVKDFGRSGWLNIDEFLGCGRNRGPQPRVCSLCDVDVEAQGP